MQKMHARVSAFVRLQNLAARIAILTGPPSARVLAVAPLAVIFAVGTAAIAHAGPVVGADGANGGDASATAGTGGDGGGATGSGGAASTGYADGGTGTAGSNGTGGGGGGGGYNRNGGAGGNSDFGTGGAGGTIAGPPKGGGEEAGGGGAFGGSSNADAGGGGGGGGGRGETISTDSATIGAADPVTGGKGGNGGNGAGSYGDGGGGGGGGIGAVFTGADTLTVNGTVSGGNGGGGGDGGLGFGLLGTYSGWGGDGGSGLRATQGTSTVIINGIVTGGDGGVNGVAQNYSVHSGGGNGGNGVVAATVINNGTVKGGKGGSPIGTSASGASGGNGEVLTGSTASSNSSTGTITGGNGSAGTDALADWGANGGKGGDGGSGVVLSAHSASFSNQGTITGGNGGAGGAGSTTGDGGGNGGKGGAGGIGVSFTGSSTTLINQGTITGGNGAAGGAGGADTGTYTPPDEPSPGIDGTNGAGGAGVSGGNLTVINSGSISGGLNGDGVTRADAITFTGGANTLSLGTGWSLTGNIDIVGAGTTATFAETLNDASIANIITGAGGVIVDDGGSGHVLTLTGTNTYSGSTTVETGELIVDGSIAASSGVTVESGGIIGGHGSVSDLELKSGATLAPGNSIGTLNAASATFDSGSIYEVEVDGAGASDLLNVAGTTTITGGKVVVIPYPDVVTGTPYTIITSASGVTGEFDEATSTSVFLTPLLTYDTDDVYLTISQSSFASVAETINQKAAATGAESLGGGNAVYDAVLASSAGDEARQAFDALSGEVHASVVDVLVKDSRYVRDAVFARLTQASYSGDGSAPIALAANAPATASRMALGGPSKDGRDVPSQSGFALWAQGYGASGTISSDGNAGGVDRTLGGFVAGVDASLGGGWRAGIASGYAHSDFSVDARRSSGDADSYHVIGYVGGRLGDFALRGGGAWTWSDIDTARTIAFKGFLDHAEASYNGDTGQAFGEIALPIAYQATALEPFARFAYVHVDTDGFTESGGAAALTSSGRDQSFGYSTLGVRVATTTRFADSWLTPHASFAWQHALGDVDPAQTLSFASGGTAFTVLGAPLARDSALIDAGLTLRLASGASLGLDYSGQLAGAVTDNAVTGRVDLRF